MSKIEEALQKALREEARGGENSVPVPPAARQELQLSQESSAIANMSQPASFSIEERLRRKLITPEITESQTVKVFRELRTKIGQVVESSNGVILVTSVAERGGTSFVAANLAAAIAFESARTALLIDCNLNRPSLHALISKTGAPGLTNYLSEPDIKIADIVHPSGIERLRVIPLGTKASRRAEYFTMAKLKTLLGEISERYPDRQVILDAPPITISADTQILAGLSDYVLLVVPYGRVAEATVRSVVKGIEPQKLLGVVLNDEPSFPALSWKHAIGELVRSFRSHTRRGSSMVNP